MNMKILKILFVSGVVSACFSLQAKTLQTFDKFIGEGHAIEVCQADLNKRALHEHCYGVNLSKTGTTTGKIEGFYNGNFDVTFWVTELCRKVPLRPELPNLTALQANIRVNS